MSSNSRAKHSQRILLLYVIMLMLPRDSSLYFFHIYIHLFVLYSSHPLTLRDITAHMGRILFWLPAAACKRMFSRYLRKHKCVCSGFVLFYWRVPSARSAPSSALHLFYINTIKYIVLYGIEYLYI